MSTTTMRVLHDEPCAPTILLVHKRIRMLRDFGLVATAVHSLLFVFPPEEREDLTTRVYEITQTSLNARRGQDMGIRKHQKTLFNI